MQERSVCPDAIKRCARKGELHEVPDDRLQSAPARESHHLLRGVETDDVLPRLLQEQGIAAWTAPAVEDARSACGDELVEEGAWELLPEDGGLVIIFLRHPVVGVDGLLVHRTNNSASCSPRDSSYRPERS